MSSPYADQSKPQPEGDLGHVISLESWEKVVADRAVLLDKESRS